MLTTTTIHLPKDGPNRFLAELVTAPNSEHGIAANWLKIVLSSKSGVKDISIFGSMDELDTLATQIGEAVGKWREVRH